MKKLNSKARVSEVADVAHRLVGQFAQETTLQNDAFLKGVFTKMKAQTTEISVALKKEAAISRLEEADDLRDETIGNFKQILLGYKAMRSAEIKGWAERLYAVFDRYGMRITRENYSSESAHIESLLRDLSASDLQDAINGLSGVAETIEELRTRQTAFHTERMAYEKAVSQQGATASATSLKKPMLELINTKLVSFLTATQEEEPYKKFAGVVAQVIGEMNETVSRRNKK